MIYIKHVKYETFKKVLYNAHLKTKKGIEFLQNACLL
jgi:hypothetical protein